MDYFTQFKRALCFFSLLKKLSILKLKKIFNETKLFLAMSIIVKWNLKPFHCHYRHMAV